MKKDKRKLIFFSNECLKKIINYQIDNDLKTISDSIEELIMGNNKS